ncbi:MAG: hypothetical protein J6K19_09655 [Prevotella sp.]|nr:hypothetical protein [Prevotella sp.]
MGEMGITGATGGGGSGGENRERTEKKEERMGGRSMGRKGIDGKKKIERSRFDDAKSML